MVNERLRRAAPRRLAPIGPAAFDTVDEASEESMICSDAPGTHGLHVGAPVEPFERSLARGARGCGARLGVAPWLALGLGCALAVGFFVLGMGIPRRRGA
jgi:hypothetical protein